MIHILIGNDLNINFSLLSNPVPLYICIYCIMLVNSEIKYCLNLKDFFEKKSILKKTADDNKNVKNYLACKYSNEFPCFYLRKTQCG